MALCHEIWGYSPLAGKSTASDADRVINNVTGNESVVMMVPDGPELPDEELRGEGMLYIAS